LGWEVLLVPDEETGSVASEPLIRAAALRNHFGLVFEPARANGAIVKSRMGVGDFIVTSRGRAAHAGAPQDGRNAILALAEYALLIARIPAELPGVLLNLGEISGGTASNIVAEYAQAAVDVRTARTTDCEPILQRLHERAATVSRSSGVEVAVTGSFHRPPKECTPSEEAAFAEWRRAAADLGLGEIAWIHTGGASDGNLLSSYGLPNLDGLGPVGGHLHSDREFCHTKTIAERAQIAALVLYRLAVGSFTL
jgi:glutamate carboxypeptidase